MAKIKVENVVATASIAADLDLRKISSSLDGAEYEQKRFPGVIYRVKEPVTAVLIFRSGKLVCTGAKSIEDVHVVIKNVTKKIKELGFPVNSNPEIIIQNIVATSDVGSILNLNNIAMTLSLERVEYEPEQFPGLVYRMDDPHVVMLLFGSGKIVCTGANNPKDAERAVDKITEELAAANLLR
jgi:transcription initiation factor TFIID TATA-box-binding protein